MFAVTYTSQDIVLSKYPFFAVLSNRGASSGSSPSGTVATSYPANTTLVDIVSCNTITTSSTATITLQVTQGLPQVGSPSNSPLSAPRLTLDL